MRGIGNVVVLLLSFSAAAAAQEASTTVSTQDASKAAAPPVVNAPPPAPAPAKAAAPLTAPSTTEATVARVAPAPPSTVKLGDLVTVVVSDYAKLHDDAAAAGKPVTLFLNGIDTGITASYARPDDRTLVFVLTRTAENLPLWRTLLRQPFRQDMETVTVSVGVKGGRPLSREPGATTHVALLKKRWSSLAALGWAIFFVLVIAGLLLFGPRMLRNDHNNRYSLGRVQLAWWFVLIVGSYVFIWLLTGDRDTITGSVLVLLGISAATTMASAAINGTVQERRATRVATLTAQAAVAPAACAGPLDTQAARITNAMNAGVPSFFRDLISDDADRPALHRYQVVVWTIVLGAFFVHSVASDLTMPQFSDTLLALMGISAGTYIGVKAPADV